MRKWCVRLAICGVVGVLPSLLQAADYRLGGPFEPPLSPPSLPSPMVEWANGWYLRGQIHATREQQDALTADGSTASASHSRYSWAGGVGVGYQFQKYLRVDVTLDYHQPYSTKLTTTGSSNPICPYSLAEVDVNNAPVGFAYNPNDTCQGIGSTKRNRMTGLVNAYFDIGTWSGITPYVGIGIGTTGSRTRTTINYIKTSDGTSYAPDLTIPSGSVVPPLWVTPSGGAISPQPSVSFAPQNWDSATVKKRYQFAWALMAGFAYDIAPGIRLDLGYRYLNLGSYDVVNLTSQTTSHKTAYEQGITLGLRWMPDL